MAGIGDRDLADAAQSTVEAGGPVEEAKSCFDTTSICSSKGLVHCDDAAAVDGKGKRLLSEMEACECDVPRTRAPFNSLNQLVYLGLNPDNDAPLKLDQMPASLYANRMPRLDFCERLNMLTDHSQREGRSLICQIALRNLPESQEPCVQ